MLFSSSLYFSRADLLGDKFEGEWSEDGISKCAEHFSQTKPNYEHLHNIDAEQATKQIRELSSLHVRKSLFVNCWHANENESSLMWEVYGKNDECIVIQTNYEILEDQLAVNGLPTVCMGLVEYSHSLDHNPIARIFHKRPQFSEEKEVRAVYSPLWEVPVTEELTMKLRTLENTHVKPNVSIPVNLNTLIINCFTSPKSSDSFHKMVCDITKKYDFTFNIEKSKLAGTPYF
jgi:hypothetical protein